MESKKAHIRLLISQAPDEINLLSRGLTPVTSESHITKALLEDFGLLIRVEEHRTRHQNGISFMA